MSGVQLVVLLVLLTLPVVIAAALVVVIVLARFGRREEVPEPDGGTGQDDAVS